jgi:signal transduction histidine kinase
MSGVKENIFPNNISSDKAMAELASIIEIYNATADKMQSAHEGLQLEVERLRSELKEKNELLERKNRLTALGEMAAGVAHEIRNPLGGIRLYASMLHKDLANQPDALRLVEKVSSGILMVESIIKDMLTFTHCQGANKVEVNLYGLIAETLVYCKPSLDDKNIVVNYNGVDKALLIDVDLIMMQQVLSNLILNAVDEVPIGGEVIVKATKINDPTGFTIKIEVIDYGKGLSEDVIKKVFDPFFTTKDSGIGLGLAIVHRLIESQNGIISVRNGDHGGAIFKMLLP